MTTRRDFLQMALTAPVLPVSLRLPSSDSRTDGLSAHAQLGSLYTVLCDERFAESVAFAEEMSRHGTPVTRFRGDITDFLVPGPVAAMESRPRRHRRRHHTWPALLSRALGLGPRAADCGATGPLRCRSSTRR